MRLDKFMELSLGIGKQDRKRLLREGKLLIDGVPALSLRQNIDSNLQEVEIDGQLVRMATEKYYMLHKPQGVISAVTDAEKMTVIDLFDPTDKIEGLYPIGRLDRFTSGLLLITNNGPIGLRMLHPDHHVIKRYEVITKEPLDPWMIEAFQSGIIIDQDTLCKPAQLDIQNSHHAYVQISEGKYHQVKKMFLSVGVKVLELKRMTFGPFELDPNLAPGQYRPLNDHELLFIKEYLD